jgi:hypothetical protein
MKIDTLKKGNDILSLIEKTKGSLKQLESISVEDKNYYLSTNDNYCFQIPREVLNSIKQIVSLKYKEIILDNEKKFAEL